MHEINLVAQKGKISIDVLNNVLGYRARRITRYVSVPSNDADSENISLSLMRLSADDISEIVRRLKALPGVSDVTVP